MTRMSAAEIAAKTPELRRTILETLHEAGSGHPGGSLSAVELVASIYFHFLNQDPRQPDAPDRDRFILSKGHGVPVQYVVMAEAGYFPKAELQTLRKFGSRLEGHPVKGTLPGIEASTGSLGQGLSIACGHALAGKLDGRDYHVYCLMGDGEINEGQIWEAALFAAHHQLDNLIGIVDANTEQQCGATRDILQTEPKPAKFEAFGWFVQEIDGHDLDQVFEALQRAVDHPGSPSCIIARTVKGKGVSFMQNSTDWHGKAPDDEQLERALAELQA